MTQGEKAKAYDEAYKKVAVRFGSNVADEIFLKYSEEERIRKAILWCIRTVEIELGCKDVEGIDVAELKSWLEKKGEKGAKGNEREIPNSEQKPAEWSKEDEQYLLVCKNALAKYQVSDKWDANIISRWLENRLKSLKDRVQPVQEWNGGDDAHLHSIITHLQDFIESHPNTTGADIQGENVAWLKSLKERYTWKPSEEYILVVESCMKEFDEGSIKWNLLKELLEQLKQL